LQGLRAAEALGPKLKKITFPPLRVDYSPGTLGGFNEMNINSRFAQRIGAHKPRNASPYDDGWNVGSHGSARRLAILQRL
jgi:hypothetical protein